MPPFRIILAASSLMTAVSVANTYKYAAIFSRLNYIWRNKYIVNLTARRDGSSRFGRKNQIKIILVRRASVAF